MKLINVPDESRLIFVSDIHGCLDILLSSLKDIGFDFNKDYIVCAGDLIDRGPNSKETLLYFLGDNERIHSVKGNHDQFLVDKDFVNSFYNGGQWLIDETEPELDYLSKETSKLPLMIECQHKGKKIGVIHAGMPKGVLSWEILKQNQNRYQSEVLWTRCEPEGDINGLDWCVHGHNVKDNVEIFGNRVYIDTGVAYNRYMTLAEIVNDEWVFYKGKNIEAMNGY